jgi:hypothetical protein
MVTVSRIRRKEDDEWTYHDCSNHHPIPFYLVQSGIRYPVVVRFEKCNYAGVSSNNYSLDEVKVVN